MNQPRRSTKSRIFDVLDYIAVVRPTLLVPVWTMLLIGYHRAESLAATQSIGLQLKFQPESELIKTFIIYSTLMSAVYILNQMCDVKTDSVNNKLYLVAKGYVNRGILKVETIALSASAIFLASYWFSNEPFYLPLVLLSAFLGAIYSLEPFRLKGRAIFDLLANVCGYGFVAFLAGWMSFANISWTSFKASCPYALFVGAAFINTTLPDIDGDKENGDSTTGTLLGIKKSCFLSASLILLAFIISWAVKDKLSLTISLFSLPLFILMAIKRDTKIITLTTKVCLLALSVAIGLQMPYYLLVLLGTILCVKWYYSARFGIKYP